MEQEQWKPIPMTGGKYEVSNHGRARTNNQRPGLLTLTKQKSGYRYVMVTQTNGKPKNWRVHRLVEMLFIPNPSGLTEVNHIDGNKDNNHVSNLEWCTRSHNVKHSFDTGLKTVFMCVCAKLLQSCLTLGDPMDCFCPLFSPFHKC